MFGQVGCSLPRNPVPLDKLAEAKIGGMPHIRHFYVDYNPELNQDSLRYSDCSFLALSGGGANGAFGAGLLCGWTEAGIRPNFRIVTGISTGALIAPIAFAGSEYNEKLRAYTTVETKDILDVLGILAFLFKESYAETKPLAELIGQTVDEEVFRAVAVEHTKGRRLFIGTANLDSKRFVVWDMGAIASSGHSDAMKLFHSIMLASASIPGAFPPVYIDVEVDGGRYDEMHVDGGVATQVFGYGMLLFKDSAIANQMNDELCSIYVIRNGKLTSEPEQVPRKSLKIISRSLSFLMEARLFGDLYRIYSIAKEDGVDFNYTSIPDDYISKSNEPFDPEEMKRLFDLGFDMAKSGNCWRKELGE
jgi:predicted acylesterase/phospholipase RssA